ncbi:MAG: hypothetical protein K2U26_17425 [Cyclobacteriaceae bacterium]|nr:hypothetical protein [Cyclobacteriaceae bacterium]
MERAITKLLISLGFSISARYVEKLVATHPDFPSLLSFSDTFQRLGIKHFVRRVKKEDLSRIPFPFVLVWDNSKGDFLLIRHHLDLRNYDEEISDWDGVLIQIGSSRELFDSTNASLFQKERRMAICAISLLILICAWVLRAISVFYSTPILILSLVAVMGTITGYFLIAKELGIDYAKVDAFCESKNNLGCDKVIKADIGLLGFHLSDAAFIYFTTQLVLS